MQTPFVPLCLAPLYHSSRDGIITHFAIFYTILLGIAPPKVSIALGTLSLTITTDLGASRPFLGATKFISPEPDSTDILYSKMRIIRGSTWKTYPGIRVLLVILLRGADID